MTGDEGGREFVASKEVRMDSYVLASALVRVSSVVAHSYYLRPESVPSLLIATVQRCFLNEVKRKNW